MCGTTETCPPPEVGQTAPTFSLTLGLPRVYHLSDPGLHVKVRALGGETPLPQDAYNKPIPAPSPETARYWEGCRAHELWLPFCRSCERPFFYPRSFCPRCLGADVEWRRSEEHTSELQSRLHLVCRLLPVKKKVNKRTTTPGILSPAPGSAYAPVPNS